MKEEETETETEEETEEETKTEDGGEIMTTSGTDAVLMEVKSP